MSASVNDNRWTMWRPSSTRKPRKDSKLHGLPQDQRRLVNKWLFDKGLTYQEVADACLKTFGLRVSRSSVGRYYERESRGRLRKEPGQRVQPGKFGTPEENYQESLKWMTDWALAELKWPVADEQDIKMVLRIMRLLIAARSARRDTKAVALQRVRFQLWAAKDCLKYLSSAEEDDRRRAARHERETWYLGV